MAAWLQSSTILGGTDAWSRERIPPTWTQYRPRASAFPTRGRIEGLSRGCPVVPNLWEQDCVYALDADHRKKPCLGPATEAALDGDVEMWRCVVQDAA